MEVKYRLTTLDDVDRHIEEGKPLFFDTETFNNSQFYAGGFFGQVRLAQFMQHGWEEALLCDLYIGTDGGNIQRLREIVHNHKGGVVGHNIMYDYSTMQEHDNERYIPIPDTVDTMHWMREVYPLTASQALPAFFVTTLGYDPYDMQRLDKKALQKSKWGDILGADNYKYAASDVFYYPQAYDKLMQDAQTIRTPLFERRMENLHIAYNAGLVMQRHGFKVDMGDTTVSIVEDWKAQMAKAERELVSLGATSDFNPNSSVKTREFIGKPSADKYVLAFGKYRDKDPKCTAILDWRNANYRLSLMEKWVHITDANGRVRGHFNPSTKTGRFQSSQENMQNSPRDMKPMIRPISDTGVFIGFDFAQIELRTMCVLTGERYMYDTFIAGEDIHQKTQDACNLNKRVIAKNVNFGLQYGMGVETFQKQLVVGGTYLPEEELAVIKQNYMAQNPSIIGYHTQTGSNCTNLVPNYSIMGTPYWSRSFTEMVNRPNQSSGTNEVLKEFFRIINMLDMLNGVDISLALSVHDSVLMELDLGGKVDKEVLSLYIKTIGFAAQQAWHNTIQLGYENGTAVFNDVPMPIDVGYGTTWGEVDSDEGVALAVPDNYVTTYPDEVTAVYDALLSYRRSAGYIK